MFFCIFILIFSSLLPNGLGSIQYTGHFCPKNVDFFAQTSIHIHLCINSIFTNLPLFSLFFLFLHILFLSFFFCFHFFFLFVPRHCIYNSSRTTIFTASEGGATTRKLLRGLRGVRRLEEWFLFVKHLKHIFQCGLLVSHVLLLMIFLFSSTELWFIYFIFIFTSALNISF